MDDSSISVIGLLLILLTIYWSFRGFVLIFERHNLILVIIYFIFLFPIAYVHMFLLGVFGSSYKKRMLREVKNKVEFDRLVEKEKNK
jgi:hypothetical protein|tara:strand:+ start:3104 stop:3364 length:261 start_codon:yes stop_codon:yes gene_type:complete